MRIGNGDPQTEDTEVEIPSESLLRETAELLASDSVEVEDYEDNCNLNCSLIMSDTNDTTKIEEVPITNENWKVFVSLIALSASFLTLAVVIYILLREKQNLHGWTQFSYLSSFLLFNLVFIPALSPGLVRGSEVDPLCFILSVSNQFFFICSKTWLLVIGFDILWNLWKFETSWDRRTKHFGRLLKYSVFGWLVPAFIVILGVSLNLANQRQLRRMPYSPGLWTLIPDYGHLHCRLPNWTIWEIFVFSNCIAHFTIFILIMILILRHRHEARHAINSVNATSQNNQMIIVFVKLFFVVGLSWSYIAIQDLFQAGNINTKQSWGWHVFRIIFFLQGVFISLVYICNAKTLRSLQDKYPSFRKVTSIIRENLNCSFYSKCGEWRRSSLSSFHVPIMKSKLWHTSSSSHANDKNTNGNRNRVSNTQMRACHSHAVGQHNIAFRSSILDQFDAIKDASNVGHAQRPTS